VFIHQLLLQQVEVKRFVVDDQNLVGHKIISIFGF
jgi:hypothetical protein